MATATLTAAQQDILDRARKALDWTNFDRHFTVEPAHAGDLLRLFAADDIVTGVVMKHLYEVAGHTCAVGISLDGRLYVLMN
jgi:hypothetical protein